jgi:hypothetical protein
VRKIGVPCSPNWQWGPSLTAALIIVRNEKLSN